MLNGKKGLIYAEMVKSVGKDGFPFFIFIFGSATLRSRVGFVKSSTFVFFT